MLSVPRQELATWYPKEGWIAPAKEKIAQAIADKYELMLAEPPDAPMSGRGARTHHHLELNSLWETSIVAHPRYLKVRLFGTVSGSRLARGASGPLWLGSDLLRDLSALYQTQADLGVSTP